MARTTKRLSCLSHDLEARRTATEPDCRPIMPGGRRGSERLCSDFGRAAPLLAEVLCSRPARGIADAVSTSPRETADTWLRNRDVAAPHPPRRTPRLTGAWPSTGGWLQSRPECNREI